MADSLSTIALSWINSVSRSSYHPRPAHPHPKQRLEENQANIKAIKEEVRLARSAEQAFEAELAEILQKIPDAPAPSDHEKKRGHGKLAEAEVSVEKLAYSQGGRGRAAVAVRGCLPA